MRSGVSGEACSGMSQPVTGRSELLLAVPSPTGQERSCSTCGDGSHIAASPVENRKGRIVYYLCQQVVRQGQGSYAHVTEIIQGLSGRGWNVQLFQPGYAQRKRTPLPVLRLPGMVWAEIRLVTARPLPDVVYVRAHLISNLVAHWCALRGIAYVEEVNGSGTDAAKVYPILRHVAWLDRWASGWRWRHAAAVITVTPLLREHVLQTAPAAYVEVVPTGANTALFHAPVDQPNPINAPYVIFFGSLAPWHDLKTMLAATELPLWPAGMRLVILGSGRQAWLAEEAARHNAHVVYKPAVPYQEVPLWVGHATAALSLLQTSNGLSPSPLKLYEAMACSVPVIVSEAPVQAELIRAAGCGLVIPEGDPAALASAVATLRGDAHASVLMGERGRQTVVLSHSWDTRAEHTHRILLRAISVSMSKRGGRSCSG